MTRCLDLIQDQIKPRPRVIIKPNFVSTKKQLSATEAAHAKAIADFFRDRCDRILVAESATIGRAEDGYANFSYYDLLPDVAFVNLEDGEYREVEISRPDGGKTRSNVSTLLMDESNFVVSAGKIKTHDTVVATLSAKNVIMASMREKSAMHPDFKSANWNMAEMMKLLHIDLAVLDGINAMQGNGPIDGERANARCVVASTDYLAADRIALEVMGVDPENVGYLNYIYELGFGEYDLEKIEIVGDALETVPFRLHDDVVDQYEWR